MNRILFVFCIAAFGLVLLRPAAASPFEKLPGVQGKTSPLLMRIVKYQGSTNGAITVEVKNPTNTPQVFTAKGIYFVPTGNPNEAPQRLGAVGPFQIQSDNGKSQRLERTTIAAGATERLTLDVYCIDSHRASPSSATSFKVAEDRVPEPLMQAIDADAKVAAQPHGGVSAAPAKPAVQSEVWKNRDKHWIPLEGEGKQEAGKSRR